ncbi:MAG: DUF484 family protein [Xanthomonadales bacterium]|nr:DUF484 family protein [Xanthomonadales bacterium]
MSTTLQGADVADYLRQHPDFLSEHPDLALLLQAPRAEGGTTQLASYQIEVLRDRNRALEHRLAELIAVAQDNEAVLRRLHLLALRLLRIRDWAGGVLAVTASLAEDFRAEEMRLLLIDTPALPPAPWLLSVRADDPSLPIFDEVRGSGRAACGRLRREQLQRLFGEAAPGIASAALLPLGNIGLLGIGSSDADRFHPGMGTDLLDRMGELIGTALAHWARQARDAAAGDGQPG